MQVPQDNDAILRQLDSTTSDFNKLQQEYESLKAEHATVQQAHENMKLDHEAAKKKSLAREKIKGGVDNRKGS